MSLVLRSLLREPVFARPLTRALRRFDDDLWFDDWSNSKVRRLAPTYESPVSFVDDMNRQMVSALKQMQEVAEDLGAIEEIAERMDTENRHKGVKRRRRALEEAVVQRTESGGLQLALDVGDFKPEDLKIKLVDDNLMVEGVSEHSGKDSYRRNHFKRWFKVPEDCKLEEIRSKMTSDNKLLIELPMNKPAVEDKARTIPIEMEKPAAKDTSGETNSSGQQQQQENQQSA